MLAPALLVSLATTLSPTPVLSAHGEGDASWTWVAFHERSLWICWDQRRARGADGCWQRVPTELLTTPDAGPHDDTADDIDESGEAAEAAEVEPEVSAELRQGWTNVDQPFARVLNATTIAFAGSDDVVWLYHRDDTFQSAEEARWPVSIAELAPLRVTRCSPTGWIPELTSHARGWRRDGCTDVFTCPGAKRRATRVRVPTGVSVSLGIEVWQARQWSWSERATRQPAVSVNRFAARPTTGAMITVDARFDPLQRLAQARALPSRSSSVTLRVPAEQVSALSEREQATLRRMLCGERP